MPSASRLAAENRSQAVSIRQRAAGGWLRAAHYAPPNVRWTWGAAAAVSLLLALGLLRADWAPWPPKGAFSDLAITHWPNAVFIQNALRETGWLPLWRPLILAGAPFAANPLSGLWYPPNVLLLFLPLPAAFNLLLALHLLWGGVGMYRLGRVLRLSAGASLIAAVAWALAPKTIAHLGAGHVGLVYAAGWLPWVIWAARRAGQEGGVFRWALAGATLAFQFLADPRLAALAAPAAVAGLFYRRERGDEPPMSSAPFAGSVVHLLTGGLIFLLLTAVQALPLAEFMQYANRATLTPAESAEFSLPWRYLLGVILPDRGGFHEWMTYAGPAVLMLAILGLVALGRRAWPVLAGLAGVVLFALGANAPLYPLLVRLAPGMSWLRVPARAWFLVAFGLALLAGFGVAALQRKAQPGRWLTPARTAALSLVLIVMDLGFMDASLVRLRPVASLLDEGGELAAYLRDQPGLFRVYSPSYSLPQHTGAVYNLQTVDGVDPLQLAETVAFVREASGVGDRMPGYSVVLPPLPPGGDVTTAHRDTRPNLDLLGLLNVRYLAAEFPIQADGLVEKARFGATYLYENTKALPRAFIVSRAEPVSGPEEALARLAEADPRDVAFVEGEGESGSPIPLQIARNAEELGGAPPRSGGAGGEVEVIRYTPDDIVVQAALDRPGVLVLSEVWYPGWEARIDGQPAPMYRADGLLRAVYLQPGAHTVEFSYAPWTVKAGLALSGLGWAALLLIGLMEKVARTQGGRGGIDFVALCLRGKRALDG